MSESEFKSPVASSVEVFNWNNIFGKIIIIFIVIIIFVVILNLGNFFINYLGTSSSHTPVHLIDGINNGYLPKTIIQNPQSNNYLLRSNNRNDGTEFTWSIWLFIKKIVSNGNENTYQNIFNKGNNEYDAITGISTVNNAPGLYLSKNTNSLRIIMDTIESNSNIANNYSDITNIPLGNWFNLVIRYKDRNIDTYMNGIIKTHLYLINTPKQNYDSIYVCQNGGFSGELSDLIYYNYALTINEIKSLFTNGPGLDYSIFNLNTYPSTLLRSTINNYLSPLWYFNDNYNDYSDSNSSNNNIKYNNNYSPIDLSLNILNEPSNNPSNNSYNKPYNKPDNKPNNNKPDNIINNHNELNNDINSKIITETTNDNLIKTKPIINTILPEESKVGIAQQTISQIIKSIPFSLNTLLFSTNFTDIMSGDIRELSKHNIDCSGNAINSFQFINPGDGTFNYDYKCSNPREGDLITNMTNYTNTTGLSKDLVNQKIECPQNEVLSQFQLINNESQLKYQYKCLKSVENHPLTCRNISTPFFKTNNSSQYLSNANITCNSDEALNQFQYIMSDDSTKFKYNYTCCKTPYSGG
jgi:hypothetical protein